MDIKYNIEFFSEWHCGSGLAAGSDVDALVVKDGDGLPFVPGKTVKGLVREAMEDLVYFRKYDVGSIVKIFGNSEDRNNMSQPDGGYAMQGQAYFSNAGLTEEQHDAIINEGLAEFLFRNVSSTCIDDEGIAVDHSLRRIETVIPCVLCGEIKNVPDEYAGILMESLKMIKRLGTGRHRGLGRCRWSVAGGEVNHD